LRGEFVDIGSFPFAAPVATEIAVTEIVGEDQHDVGRTLLGQGNSAKTEKAAGEKRFYIEIHGGNRNGWRIGMLLFF